MKNRWAILQLSVAAVPILFASLSNVAAAREVRRPPPSLWYYVTVSPQLSDLYFVDVATIARAERSVASAWVEAAHRERSGERSHSRFRLEADCLNRAYRMMAIQNSRGGRLRNKEAWVPLPLGGPMTMLTRFICATSPGFGQPIDSPKAYADRLWNAAKR